MNINSDEARDHMAKNKPESGAKGQSGHKHGGPGKALSATQVLKTLSQAAKKARTFESQKIIRKLKKLKEEDGDHQAEVKDLESQLEAVKTADLAAAASTSLKSYCSKHDIALPSGVDLQVAKPDTTTPEGKALNRILANKHLHEAVTTSAPKLSSSRANSATTKPQATAEADGPVAGSSKDAKVASKTETKKKAAPEATFAKAAPAGSSTFLPSLSAGFTFGDSDNEDDYSLSEGEDHDPEAPQRRNRRGQRARRAIWGKKFGKNAKHLQKSAHAEQLAKAAVDAKQASRSKKRRVPEDQQSYQALQRPQQQQEQRDIKRPRREEAQEDDTNMHPSWKARKAAAEKASLGVASGGFSGTKITFDD